MPTLYRCLLLLPILLLVVVLSPFHVEFLNVNGVLNRPVLLLLKTVHVCLISLQDYIAAVEISSEQLKRWLKQVLMNLHTKF